MKSNYLIILAVLCSTLILSIDVNRAFAASVTIYDSTGNSPASMSRVGDFIWIGDTITNTLYKRSVSNPTVDVATVALSTSPWLSAPNLANTRIYVTDLGTTLYEIDTVNNAILRTLATGCSANGWFDEANEFFWCATSTETVRKISFSSMSVVFTSTTLNAGAVAIDNVGDLWYDSATDNLFASGVSGTARIVVVEDITSDGTPDFGTALAGVEEIVFNKDQNNMAVCSTSSTVGAQLYNYTAGVGFTFWKQLVPTGTSNVCNAVSFGRLDYDTTSNRFVLENAADDSINVFDATNGISLYSLVTSAFLGGQVFIYSNTLTYMTLDGTATTDDFAVFDMTGIALGSSGSGGGGGTGGIDCTLPANANILICRLGSDPTCNGTVLGCVGNIVLGNSTDDSDSGLIDVICGVGFIDCNANPDIKTNGIGYLLLAVALGIEIGILWVASRGDLRQVPTFIWFIATIAIIAALTLFNWIDATMLVLGVIVAVALAAAKARGFFGGDSF